MKFFLVLLWLVISAAVVGFQTYVWRSLSSIRREITGDFDGHLERELCKHSQRVVVGAMLGFFAVFIIVYFWLPAIRLVYQIILAIVVGLFPSLFVGIAISSKKRNKE